MINEHICCRLFRLAALTGSIRDAHQVAALADAGSGFCVSGGAIRRDRGCRGALRPTARSSAPRRADRLQIAANKHSAPREPSEQPADRQLAGVKLKFTDKYRISVADPKRTARKSPRLGRCENFAASQSSEPQIIARELANRDTAHQFHVAFQFSLHQAKCPMGRASP